MQHAPHGNTLVLLSSSIKAAFLRMVKDGVSGYALPIFACGLLFLVVPKAYAQHSATITWNASATPNVLYNVYRSATVNGTYTKLTASPVSLLTYTDSTAQAGQTYFYKASAVCPTSGTALCPSGITGESDLSGATSAAVIPSDRPQPPTNVTLVSVAMNFTRGTQTLYAYWTTPTPGSTTWKVLDKQSRTLGNGVSTSPVGSYVMGWAGKGNKAATLEICAGTDCISQEL